MGISKRYSTERNQATPKEVERTIHDNGSAPGGTLLQTEYRPSSALREH